MEKVTRYFSEHLKPHDIPLALAVHEAFGASVLFGAWFACYTGEPTRRMAERFEATKIENALKKANSNVRSWTKFFQRIPMLRRADSARLVTSLAESTLLRKAMWPVLVPLKLYVSWKVVTWYRNTKVVETEADERYEKEK
eukprot:g3563.t1